MAEYKDPVGTRDKSNSSSTSLFQKIEVEKQEGDEEDEKPKEEGRMKLLTELKMK